MIVALLVALGIGLAGMTGASANPASGAGVNATLFDKGSLVEQVACWKKCNKWKCWTTCSGGPALIVPQVVLPVPTVCPPGYHWSRRWQRCRPNW
jgi:hypothetical protein